MNQTNVNVFSPIMIGCAISVSVTDKETNDELIEIAGILKAYSNDREKEEVSFLLEDNSVAFDINYGKYNFKVVQW